MKKFIYSIAIMASVSLGAFFTSCSSEAPILDETHTTTKKNKLKIILAGIEKDANWNLRSNNIKSLKEANIAEVVYSIFKEDGTVYSFNEYLIKDDSVSIDESLPPGKYKIVITGSANNDKAGRPFSHYQIIAKPYNKAGINLWDVDYDHLEFFVEEFDVDLTQGARTEQAILKRISSKLNIYPTDLKNIPTNVDKIVVYIGGITSAPDSYYYFSTKRAVWEYQNLHELKTVKSSDITWNKKTFTRAELLGMTEANPISFVTLPVDATNGNNPIKAILCYNDGTENTIILKSKYSVDKNQILLLKGNIFDTPIQPGITADTDWAETVQRTWE